MSNKEKWWKYFKDNPAVWDAFVRYTFQAIYSGRKHYSAWAVMNRIRWDREIETKTDEKFKISNNHIAYYARMFHHSYPEYDGFFITKEMKHD